MISKKEIESIPELHNLFRAMEVDPTVFGLQFFPKAFYKPFATFHKIMVKEFLKSIARITIALIPRGFGKSILVSFLLTMWLVVLKKAKFIMLISMTSAKAQELLDDIKAAVESKIFIETFGDVKGKKWSAKQAHIYSKEWGFDCIVKAAGMDEQIRGLRKGAFRIQFAIIDDPEDDKDSKNPDLISAKEEWIKKTLEPALIEQDAQGNHGRIWWLGTTLAQDCVVRRVSKYRSSKVITFPALVETKEMSDKLKIPVGNSIWEAMFTTKRLREIRDDLFEANLASVWWSEYMLDPRGMDEITFRKTPTFVTIQDIREAQPQLFMTIDAAYAAKRSSDSCAIDVAGFSSKADLYVAESVSGKFLTKELVKRVIDFLIYYNQIQMPIWKIGVESISFDIMRMVLNDEIRKRGFHVSIVPLKHRSIPKLDRIKILIPISDFGQLYMRKKQKVLLAQIQKYPSMKGGIDELDNLAYIPIIANKGNPVKEKKEVLAWNSVERDIKETMAGVRMREMAIRAQRGRAFVYRVR